jgi:L-fuculose-phosphate aldolase
MLLPDAREAIVTSCRELSRAGLVVGTAGNVSVRDDELVAVTPSGIRYADLTPDLVGVHRLDIKGKKNKKREKETEKR